MNNLTLYCYYEIALRYELKSAYEDYAFQIIVVICVAGFVLIIYFFYREKAKKIPKIQKANQKAKKVLRELI